MSKPSVNTRCVADQSAGRNEKIIEISSDGAGCLISLNETDDGGLRIEVYRRGSSVRVVVSDPDLAT